jgi:hypothetical protein
MKAPIATTTNIVPKKIVGEAVCGTIRNGARTPAKSRPNDSPKGCLRNAAASAVSLYKITPALPVGS